MTVQELAPIAQLPLPLTWQVAPGVDAVPTAPRHLHLVATAPAGSSDSGSNDSGPNDSGPNDQVPNNAPPIAWVARMARAVGEVGIGDRPAGQLTRWVERRQLAHLAERGAAIRRHPSSRTAGKTQAAMRTLKHVRAIRICHIVDGIAETSAVLVGSDRARAIAMRFEYIGDRWLITAVNLG
ncbi:MAG: Rv3235 family protein [Actinobacteria bacterium]|nr:Rv3235 family protein [Actinomycetota bacterium]